MTELLSRFLGPYRGKVVLAVTTKFVEVLFDLLTPVIVARMIDRGIANGDVGLVERYALLLVLFAALGYCFTLVCQKMAALVSQGSGTDMRNAVFRRICSLSAADVDALGGDSLVTRVTNDVNQVQVAVALGIRQLVRWPLLAIGSIVAACLIDPSLGSILLGCMAVVCLVFWLVMSRSVPLFQRMQEGLERITLIVREALSGVRVIRAFRRESFESHRFHQASDEQTRSAVRAGTLGAVLNPATLIALDLGIVAILWSGSFRIQAGTLTQGEIVAFVNYMTQTLLAVAYVANLVVTFTRGAASGERVMQVLHREPSVTDGSATQLALPPAGKAPALELRGVGFSYADSSRPALDGVTLKVAEGGTLGIIGGTGSGKSSLANLLPRLYDATEGSVLVLGTDVREYPLEQLREVVSLVPQRASLVSGTIRSNLLWRRPQATDDELWEALRLAQAADFVAQKQHGLDEPVEARGMNFSGGQRQRLTIARALVGHPRVLVLDDSASALDFATDARLRAALSTLPETATVIISQRVSAVMGADQILVLDHGRKAGLGTHHDLLSSCGLYREIVESQLSREEAMR
ncbi:ABC transporter ATP-binding protein [Olsenella porci]|uniref:ABC transporter ATP-binding protein n=1 Tax=Olsenella porci TaxID=2652279 RepID=A0A6N7X9G5_9ACTN|nr:ABC transporter ATP-binding protein [Olsenella porci]MST72057.1 ABC transporter ATP-binding protein [Olsenella porci]